MRVVEWGAASHRSGRARAAARSAAVTVLASSMATVIGPTPPGHGRDVAGALGARRELDVAAELAVGAAVDADVDHDRAGADPRAAHEPGLPGRRRPRRRRGRPRPARSARARVADRDGRVPLEQQERDRLADEQAPADHDRARAPRARTPISSRSRITPSGVHGRSPGWPARRRPWLTGWRPSTSFSGGMRLDHRLRVERPRAAAAARGCRARRGSRAERRATRPSSSACDVVAGRRWPNDAHADLGARLSLLPT